MTLGQHQRKFTLMIAQFVIFAYSKGYEMSFGDAYRDPRLHGEIGESKSYGRSNSLHKMRLAVDFNLFKNGKFLQETDDHKELGEFWESLGGSWGGRFGENGGIARGYPTNTPSGIREKIAASITNDEWILSRNGGSATYAVSTDPILDVSVIRLFELASGTASKFEYWPKAKTAAELEALTA